MSLTTPEDEKMLNFFTDRAWLSMYPLNSETVLDYFSLSNFYDPTSDNQVLKMQGIQDTKNLQTMTGIQYEVTRAIIDPKNQAKSVFVIQEQIRSEPGGLPEIRAVYYCVNGIFYQAPTLGQVIDSRIRNTLFSLKKAFQSYTQAVDFDLDTGHSYTSTRLHEAEAPLFLDSVYPADFGRIDEIIRTLEAEMKMDIR